MMVKTYRYDVIFDNNMGLEQDWLKSIQNDMVKMYSGDILKSDKVDDLVK